MLELHMLNEVERNGRELLEKDFLSVPKSLLQAPPVGGWEGGTPGVRTHTPRPGVAGLVAGPGPRPHLKIPEGTWEG